MPCFIRKWTSSLKEYYKQFVTSMTSVSLVLRTKNISRHLKATLNRHRNASQTYLKYVNRSYSGRVTFDIQDRVQSVKEKHFHQPNQAKTEADD